MKRIISGCWSILVLACILSYNVPAEAADTVVTFGDSITYGTGSTPYSSFLQEKVGGKATVVNRGKPGEQTGNGAKRISSVLAADKPTYILIMEGANDAIWGVSTSTIKFNIGVMIDRSKAAGAIPIVATVTPNSRDSLTVSIRNGYNPAISAVAAAKGAALVDAFGAVVDKWATLTYDGLHPNAAGSSILADQFNAALPYSSSGGGGGGGCFIATAAFGSGLAEKVNLLKDFRDRFLLTNGPGTSFVKFYYRYSPPVAGFIAQHDSLRAVVRILLYPFIAFAYVMLHTGLPVRLILVACAVLSVAWTVGRTFRAGWKKSTQERLDV
ncbi:MAG TPA: hypothetical protein DDY32_20620 [Desulfobulbaceae bacterium]|nr:hypothetical protein [Desulfobulbaceae bacterium]